MEKGTISALTKSDCKNWGRRRRKAFARSCQATTADQAGRSEACQPPVWIEPDEEAKCDRLREC